MKKSILPFFILISFLFISCKQAMFEKSKVPQGYGTVVIGIAGNDATRAVDSDGLPVLKDSKMTIKVTKDDGTSITEKHFTESETKTLSLNRPVGEKIVVKISAENISARWFGSAEHTVTAGTNTVSVQLKKAAAALNNLLFGTDKHYTSSVNDYTFTLKIGSKEVKKEHIKYHNFCRDNKGRTYLAYNTGNRWDIARYTSEGDKEDKSFDGFMGVSPLILASDHATGGIYAIQSNSGTPSKAFRVKEDGSHTELTGSPIGYTMRYAVHNNILIALERGTTGHELKIYRIDGDQLSEITLSAQPNLREDTKIILGVAAGWVHGEINDLYMTADTLYVLFSKYQTIPDSFSLGGIVKYSYTADGTTASISNPVRIGIANEHTSDGNGIYQTEESNFYGPVKVVGFDEQNLYIADDGIKFEYKKGKPRITANKNRIATLNKGTNALTFNNAPSGITWLGENPVWKGVKTKTIVWKKNAAGFDYYQLNSAADALTAGTVLANSASSSSRFTDVFCFDEAGNLYIVRYKTGGYRICRFELKDDGSYDSSVTVSTTLPDQPLAIAVDISGAVTNSVTQPVNALYCSYDDSDKSYIKRLTWAKNDPFSSAAADTSFAGSGTFEGPQDITGNPTTKTKFTALAADKNGFYVGETFKEENPTTKTYTIRVKKYTHNTTGYGTPESTIEVVPATTYDSYIPSADIFSPFENLTDLSIQDDVLYGVTAKEFRNDENLAGEPKKASISGKLWKIGKTDTAFTADTLKRLHSSEPESLPGSDDERKEGGKFAPYRFIAVMPKKLVIASDGFYGYIESPTSRKADQYNFIWTFELKADGSTGEPNATDKGTDVSFSKSLDNDSYFAWE